MNREEGADLCARELHDAASSGCSSGSFPSSPKNQEQGRQPTPSEDPLLARGWRQVFQGLGALDATSHDYAARNSNSGSFADAVVPPHNERPFTSGSGGGCTATTISWRGPNLDAAADAAAAAAEKRIRRSSSISSRYALRPLTPVSRVESELPAQALEPDNNPAKPYLGSSAGACDLIGNNYRGGLHPDAICCDNPAFESQLHQSNSELEPSNGLSADRTQPGTSGRGPPSLGELELGSPSLDSTWRRHCANPLYGSSGGSSSSSTAAAATIAGRNDSVCSNYATELRRQGYRCGSTAEMAPPPPLPPRWPGPRLASVSCAGSGISSNRNSSSQQCAGGELMPPLPLPLPSPLEGFKLLTAPQPMQQQQQQGQRPVKAFVPPTHPSQAAIMAAVETIDALEPEPLPGQTDPALNEEYFQGMHEAESGNESPEQAIVDTADAYQNTGAGAPAEEDANAADVSAAARCVDRQPRDNEWAPSLAALVAAAVQRQRTSVRTARQIRTDGSRAESGRRGAADQGSRSSGGATSRDGCSTSRSSRSGSGGGYVSTWRSNISPAVDEGHFNSSARSSRGATTASAAVAAAAAAAPPPPRMHGSRHRSQRGSAGGSRGAAVPGQDTSRSDGSLEAALLLAAAVSTGRDSGRSTATAPTPRVTEEELLPETGGVFWNESILAAQAVATTTMSGTAAIAAAPVEEPITANEAQGPLDAAILLPRTAQPEMVAAGVSNDAVTAEEEEERHRHFRTAIASSQCRSALQILAGDLAIRLRAAAVPSDCCYCCYSHGGGDGNQGATGLAALGDRRGQAVSPSELSSLRVQVEAVALLVSAVPYIVTAAAATTGSSTVAEEVDGCSSTAASAAATLRQLSEALLAAVSSGRCRRHHATQPCVLAAPLAHLAEALSGWTAAIVTGGDGAASAAAAAELASRLSQCGAWLLSYSRQSAQNNNMTGAVATSPPPSSAETTLSDAAVTDEATMAGGCNDATAVEAIAVTATVKATVAIDNVSPSPAASAARRPPTSRSSPGDTRTGQRDRALLRAASDAGSTTAVAAASSPAKCLKLASTRATPSLGDALAAETAAPSLTVMSGAPADSSSHSAAMARCGDGTDGTACSSDGIASRHVRAAGKDDYVAAAAIKVVAPLPRPSQSMLRPRPVEDCPANVLKTAEEDGHPEAIAVRHALPVPPLLAAAAVSYHAQPPDVLSVETKPVAAGDLLGCTATTIVPFGKPLPPTPPDGASTYTPPLELQDVVREQVKQQLQPPTQSPQPEPQSGPSQQRQRENLNRWDVASFGRDSETTYQQEMSPQLDRAAALLRTAQAQILPPLPNNTVVLLAALPGPFLLRTAAPLVPPAATAVKPGGPTEHIDQMLCQVIALTGSEGNMRANAVPEREDVLAEAAATLAARSQLLRCVLALAVTDSHAASAEAAAAETLLRARLSSGDDITGDHYRRREYKIGLLAEAIALQGAVREVRGQLYGATRLYDEALEICRTEVLGSTPHADILLLRAALTAAHGRCAVRLAALIPYAISEAKPGSRPKPAPTDPWGTPCPIPWYVLEYPSRRSTRDPGIGDGSGAAEDGESSAPGKEKDVVASVTSSDDRDPQGRQQRMMPLPSLAPKPCPRVVMAAAKAVPRVVAEFRTVCEALANSQGSAGACSAGGPAATGAPPPPPPQLMALAEVAVVLVRLQLLAAAEPSLLQTDGGTGYNYKGRCLREAMMLACAMMWWLPLTGARGCGDGSGTGSDAASSWTAASGAATPPNMHRLVPRHAESALLAAVCATALTLVYGSPLTPSHGATAASASTVGSSTSGSSTGPIAAVLTAITQNRRSRASNVERPPGEMPASAGAITDTPWDQVWDWGKIALNARQELYGVDSEPALDVQAFLAYVAGAGLGLWHVAEPLLVSLLALRGEKLGPAHRATQATATYYLDLLLRNNRFRTAENVLRRLLPRALIHQRQLQQRQLQQQSRQVASGSANAAAVAASGSSPSVSAATAQRSGGATKESKRPCTAMSSVPPSSPLPLLELQHRLEELKRVTTPISTSLVAVARQLMPGTAAAVRGGAEGSFPDGELETPLQTATTQPQVLAAAAAAAMPETTPAELLDGRTPGTSSAATTPPAAAASPADATAAIIATPVATAPLLAAEATAAALREKPIKGTSDVDIAAEPVAVAAACSLLPEPAAVALSQPAVVTTTATASSDDSGEAGSGGGPGHSTSMQQQQQQQDRAPQTLMPVLGSAHADPAPKAATAQAMVAVTGDVLAGPEPRVSVAEKLNVAAVTTAAMERPKVAAAAASVTAPPDAPLMVAVTRDTLVAAAGQPKVAAAVMMASEERLLEAMSEIAPKAIAASIVPPQQRVTRSNTELPSATDDAATAAMKLQLSKLQPQQQQPAIPSHGLSRAISLRSTAQPDQRDQTAAVHVEVGMPAPLAAVAPDGRTQTHLLAFRRVAEALRRSAEAMDGAGAPVLGGTHSGSGGGGGKAAVSTTDGAKAAVVVTDATAAPAVEEAAAQATAVAGSCRHIHDQPTAPDAAPAVAILSPLKRTSLKAVAAAFKAGLAASPTSAVAPTSSRTRSPSIMGVASSSAVRTKVREVSEPATARVAHTVPEVSEQMESGLTGFVADAVAAAAQTLSATVELKPGAAATAYAAVGGEMVTQADVSEGGFTRESEAARGAEAVAQAEAVKAEVTATTELEVVAVTLKAAVKMEVELEVEAKVEAPGKPVEKAAALVKAAAKAKAEAEAVKEEAMVQAATCPEAKVAAEVAVKMDTRETFRPATTAAVATSSLSTTSATAAVPSVTAVRSASSSSSSSVPGVALEPAAPLDRPPQYQPSKEPSPPLTCRSSLPPRRRLELAFEQESDEFRAGLGLVLTAQQHVQPPPQRLPQLLPQPQPEDERETRSQSPESQKETQGVEPSVWNDLERPAAMALLPAAVALVAGEIAAVGAVQPELETQIRIPQAPQEPEARTDIALESRPKPPADVSAALGEMATVLPHEQLAREPAVASDDAAVLCAARSKSPDLAVPISTEYDGDGNAAEWSTRGSVSPVNWSRSAPITVRAPTEHDADGDVAERLTRGSVSPSDASGDAAIIVRGPTGHDAEGDVAELSTRGSVSPSDGSGSAIIAVQVPTVYDPDLEFAERSTRGSVSSAEAPAGSRSPVVTILILEGDETDGSMIKSANPGSVSRAGSGSPIATMVAGDDAMVRWTHGSASSGELRSCRSRTATPILPPPPAAYSMEVIGRRQLRPAVGLLERVAVPQRMQSTAVGFELGTRLAQASMPVALEPPPPPTGITKSAPRQVASSATRQLDAAVDSAAAPPLQQSLVWPLHSGPPSKERQQQQQQQQQLPAPSLAASISALLATVTPLASPAPMGASSGCQTSPPSPMPFHVGLTSEGPAVTSTAAPPRADDVVDIDIGGNLGGSEVTPLKGLVQYYEETEDTEEEDGGPMQPLQPSESLHPLSLLDPLASSLSPQSSTAITAAAASPPPTLESLLTLDNLPSPLQPRPSSMDYSAPVPLQPLPLEPLPSMQDPLPSMQPPLLAVPSTLAVDSPAISWTSVRAAVPPVGAPEEIIAGVRVCPDTDISLIHIRSVRGYGLRKLEVGRGTVSARDGGDRTCYSYSSSPLATAESPLGTAAMMAVAAEASAAGPGRRAAGSIAVVGREEGAQQSWKGHESLRQRVVGLGPVPRPCDAHRLKRLPPPRQTEVPGWRPRVEQPAAATAATTLDAPVAAAAAAAAACSHQQRFRSAGSCSLSTTSAAGVGFPLCNPPAYATRRKTAEPFEVEFDGGGGTAGQQEQSLQTIPNSAVSEKGLGMGEASASMGAASLGMHSTHWELLEVEEEWRRGGEGRFGRSAREREQGIRVDVVDEDESFKSIGESEGGGSTTGDGEEEQEEGEWCGMMEEAEEGEVHEGEWCGVMEEEEGEQGKWKWEQAEEEEGEWNGEEGEEEEGEWKGEEGRWAAEAEEPPLGTAMTVWGAAVVITAGGAAPDEKPATAGAATERLRLRQQQPQPQ